jgi:hypothetical protein
VSSALPEMKAILGELEDILKTANVVQSNIPLTQPKPFELTLPKPVKVKLPKKVSLSSKNKYRPNVDLCV